MKSPAAYIEDREEFCRRRGLPGVQVRHMNTKRTSNVILSLDGIEIGQRNELLRRGKVVSISFILPELRVSSPTYVIRVDGLWVSSPTDTRTTNPHLAACWREQDLPAARSIAAMVGGVVELLGGR